MNSCCPRCGASLPPEANFCPQCGEKIKAPSPPTSIGAQIRVYLIAFFIPPLGLWYGYKYIKHGNGTDGLGWLTTSKKIGYACIVLTIVAVYLLIVTTQAFVNAINQSLGNVNF